MDYNLSESAFIFIKILEKRKADKDMEHEQRVVELDGAVNFRDIGRYTGLNGRKIKWGKIYRAASLSTLTEEDKEKIHDLNITVDCDLRTSFEQKNAPDLLWPGAKFVDISLYAEGDERNQNHRLEMFFRHLPKFDLYLPGIYQRVILNTHSQKAIAKVFQQLLNLGEDEALVYHCSAGKDRTGIISALILMGLGVDDETIIQDYMLSDELYDFAWEKQHPTDDALSQVIAKMNVTHGEGTSIKGITETLRAGWGGFDKFFTHELGFSKKELKQFRDMYLED